jgi:hypothetical protein
MNIFSFIKNELKGKIIRSYSMIGVIMPLSNFKMIWVLILVYYMRKQMTFF